MSPNKPQGPSPAGLTLPETPPAGQEPSPWGKTRVVGRSLPRVDAYERVSGAAVYPSDLKLPGMLYGAIVRSPHPHARVKDVDPAKAAAMPGVRAVLSGREAEADLHWPYPKHKDNTLFPAVCKFEGECVAAVAADTPYQARDAARAVAVEYQVLPFVADERDALKPGAPQVHSQGNRVAPPEVYSRGDVQKGFAQADVVLEQSYRTQCELHTPMELHGCVANWDGDLLTIWESTQGVFRVQLGVAHVLKMPLARVRVIGRYMGGGFGSKLWAGKYTVIAALLAKKAGRPVKLFLSREETYLAVGNRPPANIRLKAGVKKDGTLTALEQHCLATGGAFPARGTLLVDWQTKDLYLCPNVKTINQDVYINAGPARPMRAPGHPQNSWALEQMLDALARAIKMDPVELRLKNLATHSQARPGNPPYTLSGLEECLQKGAEEFGWQESRQRTASQGLGPVRRGVGMAACLWVAGGGRPPSTVIAKLFRDGSLNLNFGASDIGTGTKTVMAAVAAEELGVKPRDIQIEMADTGATQYASPSGGSKTVPTEAPAVRAACIEVKRQILALAAHQLKLPAEGLRFDGRAVVSLNDAKKSLALSEIKALQKSGVVVGVGYRGPNPQGKVVNPFGAQFCEVEVDIGTGEVKVLRFLGAHDSGRVMDRLTYENQVQGGITMGIGLAMTEQRVLDRGQSGKLLSRSWHDYKLPTHLDVPGDIDSLPIDLPDDQANTTGAKGLGEPVTIPTAAAVANAIYDAIGVRLTNTPITPLQMCTLVQSCKKEAS